MVFLLEMSFFSGNWNIGRKHGDKLSPMVLYMEEVDLIVEVIWVAITMLTIIISNLVICFVIFR